MSANSSTALIAGRTSGIGRAAANKLARLGIPVITTDRAGFIHGVTLPVDGGGSAV